MKWLIKIVKQPSTYRGLALLAGVLGYQLSPELADQIGVAVIAVLGAIEMFRDEHKKPEVQNVGQITTVQG